MEGLPCGLTMLLPHGYEGQGPEHSSARIERFLQLAANDNMEIINPTTPAQIFHLMRRQMMRNFRKPLIVFTPKSLLRHPAARSPVSDFEQHGFRHVLDDSMVNDPGTIDRILFCTGKVYYDLVAHREKVEAGHAAIVRIEQLHPFPIEDVRVGDVVALRPGGGLDPKFIENIIGEKITHPLASQHMLEESDIK